MVPKSEQHSLVHFAWITIAESVLRRLSPEKRLRLSWRFHRLSRPAYLGTLRRLTPLTRGWGYDRGAPIDRYYIEHFLETYCTDIRGRTLEVKDTTYTDRFGTAVQGRDVLDIDPGNSSATLVADLAAADSIPSDLFDCFILTQTLHLIYNAHSAILHAHRILRPGGVLLATVPVTSRIVRESGPNTDYWRFTPACCAALFGDVFGGNSVTIQPYGNVLSCIAFLTGMAQEELSQRELQTNDSYFPLIVGIRAVKR
jgi:SAM-dependent methyltransferase